MTAGACWALLWCSSPAALFSPVPVPSVHEGCILFAVAVLPSALHWQPAPAAALLGQALGHQPISVGCSSGVSSSSSFTSFSSSTLQLLLSPQHKTAAAGHCVWQYSGSADPLAQGSRCSTDMAQQHRLCCSTPRRAASQTAYWTSHL